MIDIDFDNPRRRSNRREFMGSNKMNSLHSGQCTKRKFFCLSSFILVSVGAALLLMGAICQSASSVPEWIGAALLTAGMVVVIFLTGRTASTNRD